MVFGNASAWSTGLRDVHEEVMAAILRVWPRVTRHFSPTADEDSITDQLVLEIQRDVEGRQKWLIQRVHELFATDSKGKVITKPAIDIVIFFTLEQRLYLAYECKRLRVVLSSGFRHLADRYVDEGMMRFLVGKYAPGLLFGTMLGYVMDSNVDSAFQNVCDAICQR